MAYQKFRKAITSHPFISSFLAGALASLSLPPLYVTPAFLLMGFVVYQAASASHWRGALMHISLGAYGWFLTSLYWIGHSLLIGDADYWYLLPFAFFGIPVIVSLFWSVFGSLGYGLGKSLSARILFILVALGFAEWAREFIATGFPWNAPGLIFLVSAPSAYLASYMGQTGLNILAFICAGIVPLWMALSVASRRRLMGICSALAVMMIGMSYFHSQQIPVASSDKPSTIRLIQPAIEQAEKWQADKRAQHLAKMLSLSKSPSDQPIDFVIWPEAAIAGNYVRNKDLVADMADQIAEFHQQSGGNGQWLTGVLRSNGVNKIYNSALVFRADGTKAFYDKTHLVPFGEYVPWRFIPFIDAIAGPVDFQAGLSVSPITVPNIGLVLPLICYEAIFPALTGRATQRPDLLVNITNDAWFGHTSGPYQHLAQTRMTAISYGLPLARVANTGISAVFNAKGTMIEYLPLGTVGVIDAELPHALPATIFARFGALPAALMLLSLLVFALVLDRVGQKRQ